MNERSGQVPAEEAAKEASSADDRLPVYFYGKLINGYPAINVSRRCGCSLWESNSGKEPYCIYCKWCASVYEPPKVPIRMSVCMHPRHVAAKPRGNVD